MREEVLRNAVRVTCNVSHARLFVLEDVVGSVEEALCFIDRRIEGHPMIDICVNAVLINPSAGEPSIDCLVCFLTI